MILYDILCASRESTSANAEKKESAIVARLGRLGRTMTETTKQGFRVLTANGSAVGTVWTFAEVVCFTPANLNVAPRTTVKGIVRRLRHLAAGRAKKHTPTGTWTCRSCRQLEPYSGYVSRRTGQCQNCEEMAIAISDKREAELAMDRLHAEALLENDQRKARARAYETTPVTAWRRMMGLDDEDHGADEVGQQSDRRFCPDCGSGRVGSSHVGQTNYCYECSATF